MLELSANKLFIFHFSLSSLFDTFFQSFPWFRSRFKPRFNHDRAMLGYKKQYFLFSLSLSFLIEFSSNRSCHNIFLYWFLSSFPLYVSFFLFFVDLLFFVFFCFTFTFFCFFDFSLTSALFCFVSLHAIFFYLLLLHFCCCCCCAHSSFSLSLSLSPFLFLISYSDCTFYTEVKYKSHLWFFLHHVHFRVEFVCRLPACPRARVCVLQFVTCFWIFWPSSSLTCYSFWFSTRRNNSRWICNNLHLLTRFHIHFFSNLFR